MDASAFEKAVVDLLGELYGAALRLTRQHADAEDLVADTVAKAWCSRATLKEQGRFRPWLFRILTNTFISDYRKRRLQPLHEGLDAVADDPGAECAEQEFSLFAKLHQPFLLWWNNPEKEFLNALLRSDIDKAVEALPGDFRIVIVLAELEGFSYQEMAQMLKVPVGTIRSRLARGRGLLQKALWEHAQEAGLTKTRKASEGIR